LPFGCADFEEWLQFRGMRFAPVGPVGFERCPEFIVDAFVIGVAVLNHDGRHALRMGGGEAEADRCAVVLYVQGVLRCADRGGELVDHVGEVVEGIGEFIHRRHVALAEAWIVGCNHMIAVGQLRDQVAEHLR
jgi:hypothetical protein